MTTYSGSRLRAILSKAVSRLRRDGLTNIVTLLIASCRNWRQTPEPPSDPFDAEFGTDTEEIVPLWKLDIPSPYRNDGTRYQAVDGASLRVVIEALPVRFEDFTFVDLGSGKGRSLLIASSYPFRRIVGVEFSSELNAIALENIRHYTSPSQSCPDIASLCADAATYDFPSENLVIFLYNPFGQAVLLRVLTNLERMLQKAPSRDVYVVYSNPVHADLLDDRSFLIRLDLPVPAAVYRSLTCLRQPE